MNTQTLIKARKRAKISQTEAANYLNMAISTYKRAELNQSFTFDQGLKLAELMNIKVLFYTELLTG